MCYREYISAIFDDSRRNIDPARAIGVTGNKVEDNREGITLVDQMRRYQRELRERPGLYTMENARRTLQRPGEATEEEKTDHRRDCRRDKTNRRCRQCGQKGHRQRLPSDSDCETGKSAPRRSLSPRRG